MNQLLSKEIVLKSLATFLLSPRNDAVFVLRGYAGTGKNVVGWSAGTDIG